MLLREAIPIAPDETTGTLHDRLAILGAHLAVQVLQQADTLERTPQPEEGVCYAHKITKPQSWLDWSQPAAVLERRVRAFTPVPGAVTGMPGASGRDEPVKIRAACVSDLPRSEHAVAGEVLDTHDGIHVACGSGEDSGVLRLLVLQRAGGKPLPAAEWLRGFALREGAVLSAPPPS